MSRNNIMQFFKEAIAERHSRMEQLPFIVALTDGSLPIAAYNAQLRSLSVVHATIEHELKQLPQNMVHTLLLSRPSRLAQLRRDITALNMDYAPMNQEIFSQAGFIAEKIRLFGHKAPEKLVAVLYLMEGTTFGNLYHLPDIQKSFGDQLTEATHYYTGYGDDTVGCWADGRNHQG